jgi:hypothetical protein
LFDENAKSKAVWSTQTYMDVPCRWNLNLSHSLFKVHFLSGTNKLTHSHTHTHTMDVGMLNLAV